LRRTRRSRAAVTPAAGARLPDERARQLPALPSRRAHRRRATATADRCPPHDPPILGPAPAALARRAGRHRAQLLVESTARGALQSFLSGWVDAIATLKPPRALRWSLDVDPAEVD